MRPFSILSFTAVLVAQLLVTAQTVIATPMREGTTAGGGGTGHDGKIFESYSRDPRTLPAYSEHLKKIIKNLEHPIGSPKETMESSERTFDQLFAFKTWYFYPSDLEKVSDEALGIIFLKGTTQQIARQYEQEIWVNSNIYEQMKLPDQSDLLLHEIVMMMYFIKFKSPFEICKIWDRVSPQTKKCDDPDFIGNSDFYYKPEEVPRTLNAQDNRNIRDMTVWLNQYGETATLTEFQSRFHAHEFSSLFFASTEKQTEGTKEELSYEKSGIELQKAQVVGRFPNLCRVGNDPATETECEVSLSKSKINFLYAGTPVDIETLNLELSFNGQKVIAPTVYMGSSNEALNFYGANRGGRSSWKGQDFYFTIRTSAVPNAALGTRFSTVLMMWQKKEANGSEPPHFEIVGFIFIPGVVTEFSTNPKLTTVCKAEQPQARGKLQSAIVVRTPNFEPNAMIGGLRERLPLMGYCTPSATVTPIQSFTQKPPYPNK